MMDERIIRTLRAQAWERAKGELNAVLVSYWDGHGKDDKFRDMKNLVETFITAVEDGSLAW